MVIFDEMRALRDQVEPLGPSGFYAMNPARFFNFDSARTRFPSTLFVARIDFYLQTNLEAPVYEKLFALPALNIVRFQSRKISTEKFLRLESHDIKRMRLNSIRG